MKISELAIDKQLKLKPIALVYVEDIFLSFNENVIEFLPLYFCIF